MYAFLIIDHSVFTHYELEACGRPYTFSQYGSPYNSISGRV